ncbi:MAG: hypothetical protein NTY46_04175 [Candidatus Sumerlaeota bacterium]|nr:hypothetical protein [Candidatus Sumerlaeota bacterium]
MKNTLDQLAVWLKRFEREYAAQSAAAAAGSSSPLAGKLHINIERSLWSKLLGEPLGQYYAPRPDPARQICFQLRIQLFCGEHFPLCAAPLQRFVFPDFGLTLLPSLFGARLIYREEIEPAWENKALIGDDGKLPACLPDFEHSGLMPNALDCFRRMRELLGAEWQIGFPDWCRGPLGTTAYLRGDENMLTDLLTDPGFARRVMEYALRARFDWLNKRARFLGQNSPGPAVLFNDDVSAGNLSPQTYRKQVFPHEKQCHEFHEGRIGYHSCGNLTPFLKDIRSLGPLEFFHVSPWTDLDEAVKVFHPDTRLFVALHPMRDVLGATGGETRKRLRTIRERCSGGPFTVLMTELMSCGAPAEDLAAIQRAVEIAAEVLC